MHMIAPCHDRAGRRVPAGRQPVEKGGRLLLGGDFHREKPTVQRPVPVLQRAAERGSRSSWIRAVLGRGPWMPRLFVVIASQSVQANLADAAEGFRSALFADVALRSSAKLTSRRRAGGFQKHQHRAAGSGRPGIPDDLRLARGIQVVEPAEVKPKPADVITEPADVKASFPTDALKWHVARRRDNFRKARSRPGAPALIPTGRYAEILRIFLDIR